MSTNNSNVKKNMNRKWLLMPEILILVAAVIIIVLAPKCPTPGCKNCQTLNGRINAQLGWGTNIFRPNNIIWNRRSYYIKNINYFEPQQPRQMIFNPNIRKLTLLDQEYWRACTADVESKRFSKDGELNKHLKIKFS